MRIKEYLIIGAVALTLIGCADNTNKSSVTNQTTSAEIVSTEAETTTEETTQGPVVAEYKDSYVNMKMEIPESWEYRYEEEKGYSGDTVYAFGITMWPEESKTTEFKMQYHIRFSMCGTGVTVDELSFDNGLEAISYSEIMYDENKEYIYYYLVFKDAPGDYILSYEGLKAGFDEYIDEVYQVVETLVIGENQLTKSEAIKIAEDYCGIDYEHGYCLFDYLTGEWTINLYNEGNYDNEETIYLDNDGNVIEKVE